MLEKTDGRRRLRRARPAVVVMGGLVLLLPAFARAGTYCTSRGSITYCDDGSTFYQYGDYIQSNRGDSWRKFGSHAYGSDGSWFADHEDSVTSHVPGAADPLSTRIVPDRLFGDDEED